MAQSKSGYIELDGDKIYYEEAGEGETLLLGHAGFVDSGMWDGQWGAFAERYHVVRFDMRGFGKSSAIDRAVSRREEITAVLDHLKVEKAHLLGCSMSGTTVIDYTLEHPERVTSLTAVSADPSGFEMQGEPPPEFAQMMEAVQKGDLKTVNELQVHLWVDGGFRKPEQIDRMVRERALGMNKIAVENGTFMKADMQPPVDALTPPAIGRLGEIKVPTLVIAGALDNAEVVRGAKVTAEKINGARFVMIDGTAHVPNMEKPQEFNTLVLDFLAAQK
ncbi:MAG: alpha/beta hydrolase [Chloroflexi bacterium]|nr:alpha/beta hydrolase [Chloroflexota bacterium]MCC6893368.1 alpha/beta hydrolase [Anaerolineae bacterium]